MVESVPDKTNGIIIKLLLILHWIALSALLVFAFLLGLIPIFFCDNGDVRGCIGMAILLSGGAAVAALSTFGVSIYALANPNKASQTCLIICSSFLSVSRLVFLSPQWISPIILDAISVLGLVTFMWSVFFYCKNNDA